MYQQKINLSDLLYRAQRSDSVALENIITKMSPKIKKSLACIYSQDREDAEQEIKVRLIEAIMNYDTNSVPGFWCFIKRAYESNIC